MPRSEEYTSGSFRKTEIEEWRRFCELRDKRLSENASLVFIIRSLFKLAKHEYPTADSANVTGEATADNSASTSHALAVTPAQNKPSDAAAVLPSPVTTAEISAAPVSQVVPKGPNTYPEYLQKRRLDLHESQLAHEQAKFEWRKEAFDKRLDFGEQQLSLARDLLSLKKQRDQRDERIIFASRQFGEANVPLCTYCNRGRHLPSQCPELEKERARWDANRSLPVIDISPISKE